MSLLHSLELTSKSLLSSTSSNTQTQHINRIIAGLKNVTLLVTAVAVAMLSTKDSMYKWQNFSVPKKQRCHTSRPKPIASVHYGLGNAIRSTDAAVKEYFTTL